MLLQNSKCYRIQMILGLLAAAAKGANANLKVIRLEAEKLVELTEKTVFSLT